MPSLTGTATLPAASGSSASREEAFVSRILASDDFPAFSRVMSDIMASLRGDDASAQRLANLVLRDYALTVKVIRTANTVHYNRSGRRVQSATHALMLLGARTVRDLACSLLLFDQYRRRSPGMKELMLLSLLTACHAREAAIRRGADPEAAQLCGMFRNLGEVLVAAHLPVEYTEILRRSTVPTTGAAPNGRVSRAHAAFALLGCSFEDIGSAIAQHWGMPDSVRHAIRAVGAPSDDAVGMVTAFAHALTTAIYREDAGSSREAIDRLLARYGRPLDLTRDSLAAIADAAVAETRETFTSARVGLDDLRLARQIAFALSEADRPLTPAEEEADGVPATPLAMTPAIQHPAVDARIDVAPVAGPALAALRERLVHDLEIAVDDVNAYEMQRAMLVALEAVLRGGPFDRACFCSLDIARNQLQARFGLGEHVEALIAELTISTSTAGGAVGPAIMRAEEVVLALGTRRLTLGESQALRTWGAASAGIFPVVIEGTVIGAIYVDRRTTATGFDAPTLGYLRRIVAHAARSVVVRRRPTPSVSTVATIVTAVPREPDAAERRAMVMRALKGESLAEIVGPSGATIEQLAAWRDAFLESAVAALGA